MECSRGYIMKIFNRRYTGSKYKLTEWINSLLKEYCTNCNSFFDVFGGTGVVTYAALPMYKQFIINDFLYSNEIIYKAFFQQAPYDNVKLNNITKNYNSLIKENLPDNYVSDNFGDKYFSYNDAKIIGYIRQDLNDKLNLKAINDKEYSILLASLLYSFDKISNTVGHYEAYIKGKEIKDLFEFSLIEPEILQDKKISIYREDSNLLATKRSADIAFIDPPYNSRQYSRFYHVLETIVKWDKPSLKGTAMKPPEENMSDYCRTAAPKVFADLVEKLQTKYIAVTYNNTYTSKSTSSQNKITLEEIRGILERKGKTTIHSTNYRAFNAGKTDLNDHKEFLFITEVGKFDKKDIIRSPFFYVGDKYKIMPQLRRLTPIKVSDYIEPFVGGGSSFLNTFGTRYLLNDIDPYVINLHIELGKYIYNIENLFKKLYSIIDTYNLSCSYRGRTADNNLKKQYPKIYYAKMNKDGYTALRDDFNKDKSDMLKLYILLIYGFNHMIRFNGNNKFNLPVGNVDFNKNVHDALINYMSFRKDKDIFFSNMNYIDFLQSIKFKNDSYVYLDPPYLISMSEYNKLWNPDKEEELCNFLDYLNNKGVRFGITNLMTHKDRINTTFAEWSKKYNVYNIDSNYISFNDNTVKTSSKEVFVTNYGKGKI